jgi:arylsulfatase A-like enzyme
MAGADVPAGAVITGCSLYDVAPTVLHYAGVSVPDNFDGCPIDVAVGKI